MKINHISHFTSSFALQDKKQKLKNKPLDLITSILNKENLHTFFLFCKKKLRKKVRHLSSQEVRYSLSSLSLDAKREISLFVYQPHLTSLISKEFYFATRESFKEIWDDFTSSRDLLPRLLPLIDQAKACREHDQARIQFIKQKIVKEIYLLDGKTVLEDIQKKCGSSISPQCLETLTGWIENQNLCLFFKALAEQIMEAKEMWQSSESLSISTEEKASLLRNWLQNQPILLQNLTHLNLKGQGLTRLPPEIGLLPNLASLHLDNNHLASLPPELQSCTKIKSLSLSQNFFSQVPSIIKKLPQLQFLSLDHNSLKQVKHIKNLPRLVELDLNHNRIQKFPADLCTCKQIEIIDLSHNGLRTISSMIQNLTFLNGLDLRGNQLQSLPKEMDQLAHLEQLYFSHNKFSELPSFIKDLPKLKWMSFNNNPIKNAAATPRWMRSKSLTIEIN